MRRIRPEHLGTNNSTQLNSTQLNLARMINYIATPISTSVAIPLRDPFSNPTSTLIYIHRVCTWSRHLVNRGCPIRGGHRTNAFEGGQPSGIPIHSHIFVPIPLPTPIPRPTLGLLPLIDSMCGVPTITQWLNPWSCGP